MEKLCASNTAESFDVFGTRVRHHRHVTDTTRQVQAVVAVADKPQPIKPPTEQVKLKFGKIVVQIRNAGQITAREEGDEVVIRLS